MPVQELTGLPNPAFKRNVLFPILRRLSDFYNWLWLRSRLFSSYKVFALNCPDSFETSWPVLDFGAYRQTSI